MTGRVPAALFCSTLLFTTPIQAQLRGGSTSFGLSGGASSSQLSGGSINTDFRWGVMAGAYASFRPSRNTVTAFEANWVQKGGGDTRLDYIEVPFTVGAAGPLGGSEWAGRLYTGIGIGFKVSCSSDATLLDCDNANSTEWAWPFGLMVSRFGSSGRPVGFDLRYSVGLSDVSAAFAQNRAWQMRVFLGVG